MTRITINVSLPQANWLKAEADRIGIHVSELIRRVIDQHRETPKREAPR